MSRTISLDCDGNDITCMKVFDALKYPCSACDNYDCPNRETYENKVYALVFTVGISNGHEKLIGIYDTWDKAEEARNSHMQKNAYTKHNYSIHKIELNKEVNITFAEW